MHSHKYANPTSYDDGHSHHYRGVTSLNPDVPGHIHYMSGYTTYEDGHVHRYVLATSPGIYMNGKHYHNYYGVTSFEDGHRHRVEGAVSMHHAEKPYCCYDQP
jgi:hypothetical protein